MNFYNRFFNFFAFFIRFNVKNNYAYKCHKKNNTQQSP